MILDKLAASTRKRVERAKQNVSFAKIQENALSLPNDTGFRFEKALSVQGLSFICEIKKASPSKGLIAEDFPYLKIAGEYEAAGASAISVLTEPEYFLGQDAYLRDVTNSVHVSVLRKDFTIDPYQIYEAKVLGASAVLLICSLLDTLTLKQYLGIAHDLGLSAIVEAHSEDEVRSALDAGARIIGVNNRDLKTFTVNISTSARLRNLVPNSVLFVSESGINTPKDIEALREIGADAVLVGETLMRAQDKTRHLAWLKGERNEQN